MTGTFIIGAGLSGLTVASELARETDARVTLIDAGPYLGRQHEVQGGVEVERWRPWRSGSEPFWSKGSGLKARVGGRSLCWHGVVLRIENWALADTRWPRDVIADLVDSGGRGAYRVVEDDLRAWSGRDLSAWPQADCPPETMERLSAMSGWHMTSVPRAVRSAGRGTWIPFSPLYDLPDTFMSDQLADSRVERLLLSGRRVRGVEVRSPSGEAVVYPADRVVLAAGAIENARLIVQALHDGEAATVTLRGLTDHLVQGVMVDVPATELRNVGLGTSEALHAYWRDTASTSNYFVQCAALTTDRAVLDLWAMGEQSLGSCQVEFLPSATAVWDTVVSMKPDANDQSVLDRQWELLRLAAERVGIAVDSYPFSLARTELIDSFGSLDKAEDDARTGRPGAWSYCGVTGSADHEACLLPLGGTLIDPESRVREIEGVYVAGPCVFPRSGAANPSLTTIALSRRLAKQISDDVGDL